MVELNLHSEPKREKAIDSISKRHLSNTTTLI
jgi:hypothetical protein